MQASRSEVKTNLAFCQRRKRLLHCRLNRHAQGPNALALSTSSLHAPDYVLGDITFILSARNSKLHRNFLNHESKLKHMVRFMLLLFFYLPCSATIPPFSLSVYGQKNGMQNNEFPFKFTIFLKKSPREKRVYFMIYCRFLDSICVSTENNKFLHAFSSV